MTKDEPLKTRKEQVEETLISLMKDRLDIGLLLSEYIHNQDKQIDILSQHILELQADKGRLTDENSVLAQNLEDTEICENGWKNRIEKMKSQYDYAFNQLCESREIVCLMLSQYKNKEEIDYSTRERGEKLLKQGVYKYD